MRRCGGSPERRCDGSRDRPFEAVDPGRLLGPPDMALKGERGAQAKREAPWKYETAPRILRA
jgi:hypothetical protein